ncbi:MAG: hypothetical protein UT30_C0001G0002 [Candidatus Uhrbacteria bacterium GW2011_GWF2_39_13]|uniref:Uncharacterized protein n=1 Tax=Candidatus Uhrbacteria bacterium GW2011_GWF2_39_13 TaxID=1618995 RepID=A0A0G0MPI6_9BACT|nr:MAG: hypothetical protein UT30_C0001G0002 [Candidatus Uhrbacteria bacterium GW2011_GWF2_39_13]HAU65949.1 hypothetical protein [Candidatus Uhrbacteria bacterium]
MRRPEQEPPHEQVSIKEFEIKNKEGELVARVKLETSEDLTMNENALWRKRLRTIELLGKEGQVVNIFSELGIKTDVYISKDTHGSFSHGSRRVRTPEPRSSEYILALLHELGHVKQRKGEWSKDQDDVSAIGRNAAYPSVSFVDFIKPEENQWPVIAREFRRVLDLPSAARRLTIRQEDVSAIEALAEKYIALRQDTLNFYEKEFTEEEMERSMEVEHIVRKKLQAYDQLMRDNLTELVRMEERDATIRGLTWLREWKKVYGIDLLQDGAYEYLREEQAAYGIPLIRRSHVEENEITCEEEETQFKKLVV